MLYELITLNKPWFDPQLSAKEFFNLVLTTNYPVLPDSTPIELKYLVEIMLKKNPERRATIKDILRLDFIYKRAKKMIKDNHWEDSEDFKFDKDIDDNMVTFYKNFKVFTEEDEQILYNFNKLTYLCTPTDYRPSYFGKSVNDAFNGNDLISAFSSDKWEEDSSDLKFQKNLLKQGLERNLLIPLSHKLGNDIDEFIEGLFDNPNCYYFQSKCFSFDPFNRTCDNKYLMETTNDINEDTDFLLFSQYVLDCGIQVLSTEQHKSEENAFIFNRNYLKFLASVAYFQKCDPFKIKYDETHKDRLAFFYNLYQIFGIHCYFNYLLDLTKTKSSLYGYFQNDVKLTYKFKNFSLNHLDLLHIIFRSNKPIPGSYMRLVYSSDIKCKLIPNFNSPSALFVAFKVNDSFYTIFNSKELDYQLEERILKLIPEIFNLEEDELIINGEFKPFLKDFGESTVPENPVGLLEYFSELVDKAKSYFTQKQVYKTKVTQSELINMEFLSYELISRIENKEISIKFSAEKENDADCLSII